MKLIVQIQDIEQIKNTKKNVTRCFNVIKMNVADAVPRCIQYFFIEQLVEGLDHTLKVEDLVKYVKEKQEVREKRLRCREQLKALNDALPKTEGVMDKLLTMGKAAS